MDLHYQNDDTVTPQQVMLIIDEYLQMTRREASDRMGISESHISKVARGSRVATKSFARRIWQLVRAFEQGTLKSWVPRPPKAKVGSGHVGSGAFLPEDHEPALASNPTPAARGSWRKVEEMRLRAERGEDLWHPGDCPLMRRHEEE